MPVENPLLKFIGSSPISIQVENAYNRNINGNNSHFCDWIEDNTSGILVARKGTLYFYVKDRDLQKLEGIKLSKRVSKYAEQDLVQCFAFVDKNPEFVTILTISDNGALTIKVDI